MQINGIPLERHLNRRREALKRQFLRPTHRTSFYAAMDRRRWLFDQLIDIYGNHTEVYPEFAKLNARRVGEAAGVLVPDLLDGPVSVDNLRLDDYGDSFVIKPNWGASSRGVFVLERRGDAYLNLMDGSTLSEDQVMTRVVRDVEASGRGRSDELIVERSIAVGGVRPFEWKVFTYYGEIGHTQVIQRVDGRGVSKFYGAEWEDLGPILSDRPHGSEIPLPNNPDAILDAARRVSLQVPTGFMRVDLFESDAGPVLGEVCMLPGGDHYYRGGRDRRFGQMWLDANVRILAERRPLIP